MPEQANRTTGLHLPLLLQPGDIVDACHRTAA